MSDETKGKRKESGGFVSNPALYAKMSEPFASADEANAAFKKFLDGVQRLRIKHGIREVATVVRDSWRVNDDEAQECITTSFNGSEYNRVDMLAWALGKAQKDANARVASIIAATLSSDGTP